VGSVEYQKQALLMLMPLMQKLEDNLNVCFVEFSSQATPIKRVMTLVVIPNVTVDDGASTNTFGAQLKFAPQKEVRAAIIKAQFLPDLVAEPLLPRIF
jgi:hypothetical protein